jgi:hypothetical protein
MAIGIGTTDIVTMEFIPSKKQTPTRRVEKNPAGRIRTNSEF